MPPPRRWFPRRTVSDVLAEQQTLTVSWVDLLDIGSEDRVLLVTSGPTEAETDLRRRASHVTVCRAADSARLTPSIPGYDLLCVAGERLSRRQRSTLSGLLGPHGRWVQVSDNALSPLRALDRLTGRPSGGDARTSLARLCRQLKRDAGLETHQTFVLLRSSGRPVVAFDALSRSGMRATLSGGLTHIGGVRGAALRLALTLPPGLVARLVPAWLVLAGPAGPPDRRRVVGKIANNHSDEVKIVRGDPPEEVEKRFVRSTPTAEAAALRELAATDFSLAPPLLAADEAGLRYTWLAGRTLEVPRLDDRELVAWIGRAAAVLDELQRATRQDDGTVLVHGDYWLGNLLVEDQRICGVLDWTLSRRGSPEVDRDFLVDSLTGQLPLSAELRDRLREVVRGHVSSFES